MTLALGALLLPTPALADDRDGDLLDDEDELELGTDPDNPDTDGGGRPDGYEVHYDGTDPLDRADDLADLDLDGLRERPGELEPVRMVERRPPPSSVLG